MRKTVKKCHWNLLQ